MVPEDNIDILKNNLKRGTISYFSLTKEQKDALEKSIKLDIKNDKEEIKAIKEKARIAKDKLKNNI